MPHTQSTPWNISGSKRIQEITSMKEIDSVFSQLLIIDDQVVIRFWGRGVGSQYVTLKHLLSLQEDLKAVVAKSVDARDLKSLG